MALGFNTAIAAMMGVLNDIYDHGSITKAELKTFILLLSPFAPHMTDEMWQLQGFEGVASVAPWPVYEEAKCVDTTVELPVQVNGKLRGKIVVAVDAAKDDVLAMAGETVASFLEGKTVVKQIYVPGRMVNIVVK